MLTELRIELANHPGALAAATRELARLGVNVVELAIHEVDGPRAVDEVIVSSAQELPTSLFDEALSLAGADLLSLTSCVTRLDPVVAAMTWMTESCDRPADRATLARGVEAVTGISGVRIVSAEVAARHEVTAAALRRGRTVVQRLEDLPDFVDATRAGARWLLAAPDRPEGQLLVVASRPFSLRFTSTELRRLSALLDCRNRLMQSALGSVVR
jgi:ACT domain